MSNTSYNSYRGGSGSNQSQRIRGVGRGGHRGQGPRLAPPDDSRRIDHSGSSREQGQQSQNGNQSHMDRQQPPRALLDHQNHNRESGAGAPNDCEIIAINKPDGGYLNMVENAIKDFRLKVDVMIPKADVKLSNFIESLAQKGTIFAVVIRPENVPHRSVTVHVLRGLSKPEEHRNMPLSTAYSLIQKSYIDLKKKEIGVLPENVCTILRYMLEEKTLTDREYGMLIAFLQERRNKEASFGSGKPFNNNITCYSAEELQQRILALLGSTTSTGQSAIRDKW